MYQGKDRVFYKTREEQAAADARFEQNRLLKEQNELIKKQQQPSHREHQDDIIGVAIERAREIQAEKNRQLLEAIEKCGEKSFEIIQKHSSAMKEAGIGDPESYVMKMLEVYSEDEEELKQLESLKVKQLASFKEILKRMEDNEKIIEKDNWETDNEKVLRMRQIRETIDKTVKETEKKWWEPCIIPFIGMIFVGILFPIVDDIDVMKPILFGYVIFCIGATIAYFSKTRKKVQEFLVEYDQIIEDAFLKRATRKIVKLEKRRAENFNFKLEYALLEISEEFKEFNKVMEELGTNRKIPDFRWKFYEYPQEFVDYCNEKTEKREKQEAKEKAKSGLGIFDDL